MFVHVEVKNSKRKEDLMVTRNQLVLVQDDYFLFIQTSNDIANWPF